MIEFKDIMEQQKKELEGNNLKKKNVVKIIQKKENIVRDTVERNKCVVMFGDIEQEQKNKHVRKQEVMDKAKEILHKINADERPLTDEIEEITRIGKYRNGEMGPMRSKFMSKNVVEEISGVTWRLNSMKNMKMS